MGTVNCNERSQVHQMCKACMGGWTDINGVSDSCICTAGLDKVCGTCNPVWKSNIPGLYDATFNAWVAANPKPAPLILPAPPQIGAASFACVQCTQCQDFSGLNATGVQGGVVIKDISQVQTCVGNMQAALTSQQATAQQAAITAAQQAAQAQATAAQQAQLNAAVASLAAQNAAALAAQQKTQQAALAAQAAQIDALKKAQAAQDAALAAKEAQDAADAATALGTKRTDLFYVLIFFMFFILLGIIYAAWSASHSLHKIERVAT